MKKETKFSIIITLITLLTTVLLGEVVIRFIVQPELKTPYKLRDESLQYKSGLFARHYFPQKELTANGRNGAKIYINEKGYRGKNFDMHKSEGVVRVMFYGGSQVIDEYATLKKDWPHLVGELINRQGQMNVEVINAGTSGHASFDSFGRYLSEGHLFDADYVLLNNGWNDIKYFYTDETLLRHMKAYKPWEDPRISYKNGVDHFLCKKSKLYLFLRNEYINRTIGKEGKIPTEQLAQYSEHAIDQYRIIIETFVDMVRNSGAEPILMTQPRIFTRNSSEDIIRKLDYKYTRLTLDAIHQAYDEIDKVILDVASKKNVQLIDSSKYMTGQDQYFLDHVHLNAKGSTALAEFVADKLSTIISP